MIVAGLDQDYRGQPFEPMPQMLAIAESITKTLAICVKCGNDHPLPLKGKLLTDADQFTNQQTEIQNA